jgi:MurNAc alpha-1-phosphate uridylyltransferase
MPDTIAFPQRAMILAAGEGSRLRPLTDRLPKPLIPVGGRPILGHLIGQLDALGVTDIIVNACHRADQIIDYLADRPDIHVSRETVRLETGGGVYRVLNRFQNEAFFALNGDSFWKEADALRRLASFWDPDRMDALLLLQDQAAFAATHAGNTPMPGDFFRDSDGRLTRRGDAPTAPFINASAQIVHPRLFDTVPAEPSFSFNVLWNNAIARGRLFGVAFDGTWIHINTLDDLTAADSLFKGV